MTTTTQQWQMQGLGVDALQLVETAVRQPGPGEVLVKVAAVSLNYRDLAMVQSGMGSKLDFPLVPGSDMAGTVVATGAGVSRVTRGQRVISTFWSTWFDGEVPPRSTNGTALGGPLPGVLSRYLTVPEDWLVRAPETLDDLAASTLTCAGLTAWFALVESGGVQAGQTVLVQGTGGVALFAAQIALARGATVIMTSASDSKLEKAKALGVQHVVNRLTQPDWPAAVREMTGGLGVDHALELVGGSNIKQTLAALKIGGRVSVIGVLEGFEMTVPAALMFSIRPVIQGIGVGHRAALHRLAQAVDSKGISPVIDAVYDFADLKAALAHVERGAFGKVVVRLAD
ncbi:zinc-dependent alcohol dehydrogenase family protein [Chitinimonas naiadis]